MSTPLIIQNPLHETGLFNLKARFLSTLHDDIFDSLKEAETKITLKTENTKARLILHSSIRVGSDLSENTKALLILHTPKAFHSLFSNETWIQMNENASDVIILSFDIKSKEGLIFIKEIGIWYVVNFEYTWRSLQDLDLIVSVNDEKILKLESLK